MVCPVIINCIIDLSRFFLRRGSYLKTMPRVQGKEQRKEVQQTHRVVKRGLAAWLSAKSLSSVLVGCFHVLAHALPISYG